MRVQVGNSRDHGFSFIELLAYMAIAALLILAAIPQFNNYRGQARDASTVSDVRNVGVAMESWAIEHPGEAFPEVSANWGSLGTYNVSTLTGLGVTLTSGTRLWVQDRADRYANPSATFPVRGMAFCVFAYNDDGRKYNSKVPPGHAMYHSGDGGPTSIGCVK